MADGDMTRFDRQGAGTVTVSRQQVREASLGLVQKMPDYSCYNKVRHGSALVVTGILVGAFGLFSRFLCWGVLNFFLVCVFAILISMRGVLAIWGVPLQSAGTPAPARGQEKLLPR